MHTPKSEAKFDFSTMCADLLDRISYPIRVRLESVGVLSHPDKPIRIAFFKRLSMYATCAFIVSLVVSFVFETNCCLREVRRKIESKFVEAYESSEHAKHTFEVLRNGAIEQELVCARSITKILSVDPAFLDRVNDESSTELEELARLMDVDEIFISDETGVIIASCPKSSRGFDYKTSDKAKEFLKILDDPELEIVQPIRTSEGTNGRDFQYAAVARTDARGIVEVGYNAEDLNRWLRLADASNFVSPTLGHNGFLTILCENQQILGYPLPNLNNLPIGRPKTTFVDDRPYFVYSQLFGNLQFIGGIPYGEVFYERSFRLAALVVFNFLIFFMVFTLVSFLVQRLFVRGVNNVNDSLHKIAQGDLNERVRVDNSKEFVDLSNGVNATVDSIKTVAQEVVKKTQEELALAGKIQKQSLPNFDELFADQSYFEVCAQNLSKSEVGGDMYDCFFTSSDDLWFYVADVSGNGVPAALVMMKTITLIKNLALSGNSLAETITSTNRFLSVEDRTALVSGFFCCLNLKTGSLQTINAGHVPPILRRPNDRTTYMDCESQIVLGANPDQTFTASASTLAIGDEIVLYSDGFRTCDVCGGRTPYTKERLLEKFERIPRDLSAADALQQVFNTLSLSQTNLSENAPDDDETVMVFRFLRQMRP